MPVFILAFGVAFSFFMYVIPSTTGWLSKIIIAIGLAAAGNVIFLTFAPDFALQTFGGGPG